ncbi:MAG: GtrA family protein [Oscillospiraceae bacterium]|nr:GtrA family protein [Oscillospiraceae bacterium]
MIEKIKALCIKYRELIVYVIVGGLTTVVAWGCKFLWNILVFGSPALPTLAQNSVLSLVENVSGILFAYPLNRRWVFQSKNPKIFAEFIQFVGSRVATWVLGWVLNLLMVNVLHVNVYVSTIVVGVVVVVGNYVLSKLFVFKKK